MSVASISATKRCGSGGTDLVRCSPLKLAKGASISCGHIQIGNGTWTRSSVKINGETHYLWRAVDHEGEVLESYVTKRRDRKAALKFLRKTMKRFGRPHVIVTDLLRSYGAAMKIIGNADHQETGRWLNNRAENSHQPFRRRERAMLRFRRTRTLQKFVSVHASVNNHFNQERHLYSRANFKLNRAVALSEWRQLGAA
jgi:putative transposase